jgi:hypothetical protein
MLIVLVSLATNFLPCAAALTSQVEVPAAIMAFCVFGFVLGRLWHISRVRTRIARHALQRAQTFLCY